MMSETNDPTISMAETKHGETRRFGPGEAHGGHGENGENGETLTKCNSLKQIFFSNKILNKKVVIDRCNTCLNHSMGKKKYMVKSYEEMPKTRQKILVTITINCYNYSIDS